MQPVPTAGKWQPVSSAGKHAAADKCGKTRVNHAVVGVHFVSDWLKKNKFALIGTQQEMFQPIIAYLIQNETTFDSQLEKGL